MKTKTVFAIGLSLLGAYKLFSKTQGIINAYDTLRYRIANIHNFKVYKEFATFNFDLKIINPTPNGFGDLFGFVTIKDILFLNEDGTAFATANLPAQKLFIPGNQTKIIQNIEAKVLYQNINFQKLIQNLTGGQAKFGYVVNFDISGIPYSYESVYDLTGGGMNGICYNRAKCPGLKKNGQLRKGYKFIKGGAIKKI